MPTFHLGYPRINMASSVFGGSIHRRDHVFVQPYPSLSSRQSCSLHRLIQIPTEPVFHYYSDSLDALSPTSPSGPSRIVSSNPQLSVVDLGSSKCTPGSPCLSASRDDPPQALSCDSPSPAPQAPPHPSSGPGSCMLTPPWQQPITHLRGLLPVSSSSSLSLGATVSLPLLHCLLLSNTTPLCTSL